MAGLDIFERLGEHGHEQLVFCNDGSVGLRAVIAIHDTTLGPALGGIRMHRYASEAAAVTDVLRLARGMTFKAAASGLDLGGGKAVILGDPRREKSPELFRSFGRYVESLGGRYIASEDVGVSPEDLAHVHMETSYAVGEDRARGGSGDPSPFTALGVLQGIRACVEEVYGSASLAGLTVAVQGVGSVGYSLCRLLHEEGASLVVADVDRASVDRAVAEFGARAAGPEEIPFVACDIFAPCALGAVADDASVPRLRCRILAGSANNVLLEPRHGEALAGRGILYAPDYIINAGGLINVSDELHGYDRERVLQRVNGIYDAVKQVLAISKRDGIPPHAAADTLALDRLRATTRS